MARKRTFGELKVGSYIWSASIGSVSRLSVIYVNPAPGGSLDTGKVKISCGHSINLSALIDKDATKFGNAFHHWYTDKQDARKCAYQLLIREIREKEQEVSFLKKRAKSFRENFLPDAQPEEEDYVLTRINRKVHEELEKQKAEGKEFLTGAEIDGIIAKVLEDKNY